MENVIMNMKKITALLLAMLLVVSFAACGNNQEETQAPTDPQETEPAVEALPVDYLSLTLNDAEGNAKRISAYVNEDGSASFELYSDIIKKGNLDSTAWNELKVALTVSGLPELNGATSEDYSEITGEMYFTCGEESYYAATYYNEIPAEFIAGYNAVEAALKELAADVPEYVPAPLENGIIAEADRAALNEILGGMTLEAPDSFAISNIPLEEGFEYSVGLPSYDGIESAVTFAPMMNANPYSLAIVTLNEGTDANAIAKDFEENIDWLKLVCVQPESAAIAVKGNQVLCLLGSGDLFDQTVAAISAANWIPVANLENPNLEG